MSIQFLVQPLVSHLVLVWWYVPLSVIGLLKPVEIWLVGGQVNLWRHNHGGFSWGETLCSGENSSRWVLFWLIHPTLENVLLLFSTHFMLHVHYWVCIESHFCHFFRRINRFNLLVLPEDFRRYRSRLQEGQVLLKYLMPLWVIGWEKFREFPPKHILAFYVRQDHFIVLLVTKFGIEGCEVLSDIAEVFIEARYFVLVTLMTEILEESIIS